MVIFEPEYLALLMRLGEEDAEARHDEIESFLRGGSCAVPPLMLPAEIQQIGRRATIP